MGQRGSLHNGSLQTPDGGIQRVPPGKDPASEGDKVFGIKGFRPVVPAARAKAKCGDNVEALADVWL